MSAGKTQGSLYRYDSDGSLHLMETKLAISNGLGWSPDQKTFYLTDSPTQKMYAYNFDAVTGKISDRRIFVDLTGESFYPDGMTVDIEGEEIHAYSYQCSVLLVILLMQVYGYLMLW